MYGNTCDMPHTCQKNALKVEVSSCKFIYNIWKIHILFNSENLFEEFPIKMHVGYSTFREVSTIDISNLSFFLAVSIKLIAAWGWNELLSYIQLALNNFYVHGSVHRESMWIIVQRDTTIYSFISVNCSVYMFRAVTPPFIRSTYNCNHSIWHWSNRLCYLPLSWSKTARSTCFGW